MIPAIAETVDVQFNQVRINIEGKDVAQWGENYTLKNGDSVPYSITYKNTTYLPMRKLGELLEKDVSWNGDSNTVSVTSKPGSYDRKIEKTDANGNVWQYFVYWDEKERAFLAAEDPVRGYRRVYRLVDGDVQETEDALYFIQLENEGLKYGNLVKLDFCNDGNTQDGTVIKELREYQPISISGGAEFMGDYLYIAGATPGTGTQGQITILNYATGEVVATYLDGHWNMVYDLDVIQTQNADEKTVIHYNRGNTGGERKYEIIFDWKTKTFGQPTAVE